jgi:hypothetical protein
MAVWRTEVLFRRGTYRPHRINILFLPFRGLLRRAENISYVFYGVLLTTYNTYVMIHNSDVMRGFL